MTLISRLQLILKFTLLNLGRNQKKSNVFNFFIFFLIGISVLKAQPSAKDTILTNGVRVSFDLGKIAYYFLNDKATKGLEVAVDAGYHNRFAAVAEIGIASEERSGIEYGYKQSGWYTRLGIDKNVLKGGDDAIFFGLRYALSNFNYEFSSLTIPDPIWGNDGQPYTQSIPKTNAIAHWLEGVAGMKGTVVKNFYLGYTIRVKVKIADGGYGDIESTSIPGFGKTGTNVVVGMSYYVSYRIPLKQTLIKPKVKKEKENENEKK